jgi:hypothetical protein
MDVIPPRENTSLPQIKNLMTSSPPEHVGCLVKNSLALSTADGCKVELYDLIVQPDKKLLSDWARHFRQNYCNDADIDVLRNGTGFSRAEYLTKLIFPDEHVAPGPSIRAGDFAELLISDLVEFQLGYWVPREKYAEKASRNESVKGVDILGFLQVTRTSSCPDDALLAFEVKAQLSDTTYGGRLQTAVDDSSKDFVRQGTSLNATKQRLLRAGRKEDADIVARFQNMADRPYQYRSGAAAVLTDAAYDEAEIQASTDASGHLNRHNLELVVVRGSSLMKLAHTIYKTCADEA